MTGCQADKVRRVEVGAVNPMADPGGGAYLLKNFNLTIKAQGDNMTIITI